MKEILLVEDERDIADSLELPVQTMTGHKLVHCETIEEARRKMAQGKFAAIVLDLNLPDGNGVDFCKEVRQYSAIPILMLTARRDEVDRILGLELGADDYIVKPFSPREVAARINAVLRRREWEHGTHNEDSSENLLEHCGIIINETRHEVSVDDRTVHLTRTEYRLLATMMKHPGQVYTREMIVEMVWDGNFIVDRVVDSVVSRIRRKLGKLPDGRDRIKTVHGVGYAMTDCQ
jgi:two-component system catabolic regulation response regulator CreB